MINIEIVTTQLRDAGFIAASEEARELLECANGDAIVLKSLVERRLEGEPLAWITGCTIFCDVRINVDRGVFVPRWQSEPLARRAASRVPVRGVAIDLCTGSGAIAKVISFRRPHSRVVATDIDDRAVMCATSNGVEVFHGDLFAPLPRKLEGKADVIVGIVPYVPTSSMSLLPRDTLVYESTLSYDGGDDGTVILRRVLEESTKFLRPGGALLLELGGEEADLLSNDLARHGFTNVTVLSDEDGEVRGIEADLKS